MNRETSERVRASLAARGWHGDRSWHCPCGVHENGDARKSLSITERSDGTLLMNCHAGGSFDAILSALDVQPAGEPRRSAAPLPLRPDRTRRAAPVPARDFGSELDAIRERTTGDLAGWASRLGVSASALAGFGVFAVARADIERLHCGFSGRALPDEALAYPEYDGGQTVRGLALRAPDGRKGCAAGSSRGIARPLAPLDTSSPLFCTEGASDAWALTSIGLQAIARPSNSIRGPVEHWLAELLLEHEGPVFFLLDRKRGEASVPLIEALARRLHRVIRYGYPPHDAGDCRDWLLGRVNSGLVLTDEVEMREAGQAFEDAIAAGALEALPDPDGSAWRPFPIDALPEPLRSFATEQAEAIGVDVASVAVATLGVAAAAIGNARGIRLKGDWREPAVLWFALVAESGSMKGPTLRPALRPLIEIEKRLHRAYEARVEEFRREQAKAKEPGRSRSSEPLQPEPRCERRIVNDVTVEALAPILHDSPRGLLLFNEEGAAWLDSFGEYKSGGGSDSAKWCQLYDAQPIVVDRKGGATRTVRVDRASVSVLVAIQPELLARRWTPEATQSGLFARCSIVMPPGSAYRWTDAEVSAETRCRFLSLVERLAELEFDPLGEIELTLDSEAQRRFIEFANEIGAQQALLTDFEAAKCGKTRGLAARLALVLALARDPATRRANLEDIGRAITVARWLEAETLRIAATFQTTEEDRHVAKLAETVRRRGGAISVRDYQHGGPQRFRASATAARAELDRLVAAGLASWRRVETGGRPSEVLELNETPRPLERVHATRDKSDRSDVRSTRNEPESGAA
jgi:hypothetical protein